MSGDNRPQFDEWLNNNGAAVGFIMAVVFVIVLIVTVVQSFF